MTRDSLNLRSHQEAVYQRVSWRWVELSHVDTEELWMLEAAGVGVALAQLEVTHGLLFSRRCAFILPVRASDTPRPSFEGL